MLSYEPWSKLRVSPFNNLREFFARAMRTSQRALASSQERGLSAFGPFGSIFGGDQRRCGLRGEGQESIAHT